MKAIQKQFLEDIVVKETAKVLASEHNLELIANAIIEQNKNAVNDNTNLKMLEKQKAQAEKSTKNIVKAIEQGIITEATKTRLQELEMEIAELDFAINKEKQKSQAFLTKEQVLTYLKSQVIENCNNIKIRKSLINTLVREIILYNDKIYINFNFTDPIEPNKITKETIEEKEKQIKSALKNAQGSCILPLSAPNHFEINFKIQYAADKIVRTGDARK